MVTYSYVISRAKNGCLFYLVTSIFYLSLTRLVLLIGENCEAILILNDDGIIQNIDFSLPTAKTSFPVQNYVYLISAAV